MFAIDGLVINSTVFPKTHNNKDKYGCSFKNNGKFGKHGLNQFSLQESQDGQMNLILNEGLLITSIGDEDTYLAVLERIISECSTVREIMEETSNKLQDEMLLG